MRIPCLEQSKNWTHLAWLYVWILVVLFLFCLCGASFHREIDAFIEHLKEVIAFFEDVNAGGTNGHDGDDDGFVPFI